jgi:hypothetical protein
MKTLSYLSLVLIVLSSAFSIHGQNCPEIKSDWLKKGVKLNYVINKETPFKVEIKNLEKGIDYLWYKNGIQGFDVSITEDALNNAYKQYNYIYGLPTEDTGLMLNDATSIFCSRKMFDEMVKNKKVTYYPYAKFEKSGFPVTLIFKEKKNFCIKQNGKEVALECLVFEQEAGVEQLVVLNNPDYPLIVEMRLSFTIQLSSIE